MARMYSRKRGKHGSKKPAKKTVPSWTRYKPKEIELIIVKHAKEGKLPGFKVGANWRFKRSSIDRWISNQEEKEAAAAVR